MRCFGRPAAEDSTARATLRFDVRDVAAFVPDAKVIPMAAGQREVSIKTVHGYGFETAVIEQVLSGPP
jgi:hypothetical protein